MSARRLPFDWPTWVDERRAAASVMALGAVPMTGLLCGWMLSSAVFRALLLGSSAVTAFLLASWVSKAQTPGRVLLRGSAAGVAHGLSVSLVLPTLFFFDTARRTFTASDLIRFVPTGALVSTLVGGILGLFFGILPAIASRIAKKPTHANVDRVVRAGGRWLLAIGGVHAATVAAIGGGTGTRNVEAQLFLDLTWTVPAALAVVLLASVSVRGLLRRRFLEQVEHGRSSTFRIVDRARVDVAGLQPFVPDPESAGYARALVRVGPPPREVLYRETAEPPEDEALALLP